MSIDLNTAPELAFQKECALIKNPLARRLRYFEDPTSSIANGLPSVEYTVVYRALDDVSHGRALVHSETDTQEKPSDLTHFLYQLANDSVHRQAAMPKQDRNLPNVSLRTSTTPGTCFQAEHYFTSAAHELDPGALPRAAWPYRYKPRWPIVIFEDATGVPVILKKAHNSSTGLLLDDISVSGIGLPAGMIVNVNTHDQQDRVTPNYTAFNYPTDDAYRSQTREYQTTAGHDVRVLAVNGISAIQPLRLSIWFHKEQESRQRFMESRVRLLRGGDAVGRLLLHRTRRFKDIVDTDINMIGQSVQAFLSSRA